MFLVTMAVIAVCSDAMLFKDSDKKQWLPRAPTASPTSPYSPRMARRRVRTTPLHLLTSSSANLGCC